MLHLLLHALVPLAIARTWFRARWRSAWLWLLAGWLMLALAAWRATD